MQAGLDPVQSKDRAQPEDWTPEPEVLMAEVQST
jgi:hypothetical protein